MASLIFVRISAVDDRTAVDDVTVFAVQDTDKLQQANKIFKISDRNSLKMCMYQNVLKLKMQLYQ